MRGISTLSQPIKNLVTKHEMFEFTHQISSSYTIDYKFWKTKVGWRVIATHYNSNNPPSTVELFLPEEVIDAILADRAAAALKT